VKPTLVRYYCGGKSELLGAVLEQVAGEVRERLSDVGSIEGEPEARLRSFVTTFVHALAADPYTARLVAEHVLFPDDEVTDRFAREVAGPNLATLRTILSDGRAAGAFDELDDRFVTPIVVGACVFFFMAAPMLRRLLGEDMLTPANVEAFADHAAELAVRGVRRTDGS
jgi:AcrR family transcriptional regulator